MKSLWMLEPVDGLKKGENPWGMPYDDKVFGLIVRASDEIEARTLAQAEAGAEADGFYACPWLDEKLSTCKVLRNEGESGVVIMEIL